ncbi:MAG: putative ATPase [Paracoccaceae bacterium]|jgi:predicted ATPase
MARKKRETSLPSPFLKRLTLNPAVNLERSSYPFDLPWLGEDFELKFTTPVTVIMGENGSGKSTPIEAIAALSGYDETGGGKGYRPLDHDQALDRSGAALGDALRAGWLPKITVGWFFRPEGLW